MTIKQIKAKLEEHLERKTWGNDYTGPYTTPEEDEAYLIIQQLLTKRTHNARK